MRLRAAAITVVLVTLGAACSGDEETAIDAVVSEGDPPLGRELDLVRVAIGPADDTSAETHATERIPAYDSGRFSPLTVRLEPDADRRAGTVYRVRAEGIADDRVIVRVQHRVTFVAGRTIVLAMRFEGTCVEVTCGGDQTCEDGRCVDDSMIDCALGGGARGCDSGAARPDASTADVTTVPDTGSTDASSPEDTGSPAADSGPSDLDTGVADSGPVVPVDSGPADTGPAPPTDSGVCCPNDGLSCTTDECVGRGCRHSVVAGFCVIGGACVASGSREPGNDCRECNPAVSLSAWIPRGGTCSDGLYCTTDDICVDGACIGEGRVCIDGRSCTADTCDEDANRCQFIIVDDRCLIDSVCYASGADSPDNPCRTCRPAVSQTDWSDAANGTGCSDGLSCTGPDLCESGVCVTPSLCTPSEVCRPGGCECAAGNIDCNGSPDDGCECIGETCLEAVCG